MMIPMKHSNAKQAVQQILAQVDVQVNGTRSWDIQVHNQDFYSRILEGGSLALGESYMDGWWSCAELDQLFDRMLSARLDKKAKKEKRLFMAIFRAITMNAQSRSKAYIIGKRHYDIGNHLFSIMIDKRMNYSCGYWENAITLDDAQEAKLDLICRKLLLKPGMTVLDIGCGWGGFAKWAAERYDVKVLGITVSHEQVKFATEYCKELDVKIKLQDYRELKGEFDRIVSIGMFEHVGSKNYKTFMKVVRRCLKAEGLFLLHTIAGNTSVHSMDPWIRKYIFPNSMLPSAKQISSASEGILMLEDWHSFGQYYDQTLMAWHQNFTRNWDKIKDMYDNRFYRMWTYYLLLCAGTFRSRRNQLWQIVFSKKGLRGGYQYKNINL
jgi:cyclopropane-fatty-acyl-phospholipid synthase